MKATLKERISTKTDIRIGVIGVGYVGLPLAVRLAEERFSVIGVDVSPAIVKKLRAGKSTVEGIDDDRLNNALAKGLKLLVVNKNNPAATSRRVLENLVGVDVFLICVPTPLDQVKEWEPDPRYIKQSYTLIARICDIEKARRALPKERLIVLESTTYPGTTREVFSPLISKVCTPKRKWYLAYSPERTNPAPNAYENKNPGDVTLEPGEEYVPGAFQITRVIGGFDEASRDIGQLFYETVFDKVRVVSDLETAEMVKLVENTFRFTSIAFANEIARVSKTLGLNVWEVIEAARSKQFGFQLCFPGLIGGHCLPIDPHYLSWVIRNRRLAATFVDVAESEHQRMRREAFDLIQRLLNQHSKGIAGASVLFFGVSYKKGVGDIRESAAIKLMQKLHASGAQVSFWDPVRARHPAKPSVRLVFSREKHKALPDSIAKNLKKDANKGWYYFEPEEVEGDWKVLKHRILSRKVSCVVLATDHEDFRVAYQELLLTEDAPPIADLSNAINWWLRDTPIRVKEKIRVQRKLADRRKYMLLGRH